MKTPMAESTRKSLPADLTSEVGFLRDLKNQNDTIMPELTLGTDCLSESTTVTVINTDHSIYDGDTVIVKQGMSRVVDHS